MLGFKLLLMNLSNDRSDLPARSGRATQLSLKAHLHCEKGGTDRIKIGTGTTKKSPFTQ